MKHYIKLIRPHQWVKNGFILLPLFFSLRFIELPLLGETLIVAAAFCLVASAIYVLNDLNDVDEDRNHPVKKFRPLASGAVKPAEAYFLIVFFLAVGLPAIFFISPNSFYITLAYVGVNFLYSLGLKHIPIIDISMIAIGFVLRLFIGAKVDYIPLSHWIIIMTFLLALFLALAKRRDDVILASQGNEVRKSIDGYNLEFCNGGMMIMASVTLVSYVLYCISPEIILKFGTDKVYLTVFFVIIGILRYMQITFVKQESGSPTKILLRDFFLQITIAGWILAFVFLMYYDKWLK